MDPSVKAPSPPVHAARLSALLKTLASAEGAVAESIKARKALIEGLEKLLDTNKSALATEEAQAQELGDQRTTTELKKQEVEDSIMRGISGDDSPPVADGTAENNGGFNEDADPARPEYEEFTPPPAESLTPVTTPPPASTTTGADLMKEQQPDHTEPAPAFEPPMIPAGAGADLLSSLSLPAYHAPPSASPVNGNSAASAAKKRKVDHEGEYGAEDFTGDVMQGLDADVAELLRQESGGAM